MADPLSDFSLWVVSKLSDAAISYAEGEVTQQATDLFSNPNADLDLQFAKLTKSMEKAIAQAEKTEVNQIKGAIYESRLGDIESSTKTWWQEWGPALQKARKGDTTDKTRLITEFEGGHYSAHNSLNEIHDIFMGQGTFNTVSGGYLKVVHDFLMQRMKDVKGFQIQQYYDSIVILLAKSGRLQLMLAYFRCCASSPQTNLKDICRETANNIKIQRDYMLKCMPGFIKKIKPTFDSPIVPTEKWWRFQKASERGKVFALTRQLDTSTLAPWQSNTPAGVLDWQDDQGGGLYEMMYGPPFKDWQFTKPLLVDREPNPEPSNDGYPQLFNRQFQKTIGWGYIREPSGHVFYMNGQLGLCFKILPVNDGDNATFMMRACYADSQDELNYQDANTHFTMPMRDGWWYVLSDPPASPFDAFLPKH